MSHDRDAEYSILKGIGLLVAPATLHNMFQKLLVELLHQYSAYIPGQLDRLIFIWIPLFFILMFVKPNHPIARAALILGIALETTVKWF